MVTNYIRIVKLLSVIILVIGMHYVLKISYGTTSTLHTRCENQVSIHLETNETMLLQGKLLHVSSALGIGIFSPFNTNSIFWTLMTRTSLSNTTRVFESHISAPRKNLDNVCTLQPSSLRGNIIIYACQGACKQINEIPALTLFGVVIENKFDGWRSDSIFLVQFDTVCLNLTRPDSPVE